MPVDDGFYIEVSLNRAVLNIGATTKGSYTVYGHTCPTVNYFIGWELLFYAGAGCEHFTATYQQDTLLLVGGIHAEIRPLTATAQSGSEVGVGYSVSGGLEPYQEITILGTSHHSVTGEDYGFMEQIVTETEGMAFGKAHLGDQVYFEIRVVEADGYVSTWRSESIPMSDAPAVAKPKLTASLSKTQLSAGETVTLTWQMVGGSGTINKLEPENSYVQWKNADGSIVSEALIAKISGTADFVPEEDGDYTCTIVLTDGYNQRVEWTSRTIRVRSVRIPGDADLDGVVSVMDALMILQYDVGWDVELQ